MPIPENHLSLNVDGVIHSLAHLGAFSAAIPRTGIEPGTDLDIKVYFSCHVYTERAKHNEDHDCLDHHDTRRVFDAQRYAMSHDLPAMLRAKISADALSYVSRSFGDIENLILLDDRGGLTWTIVYCLLPVKDPVGLRMDILSAHPKVVDQKKISRKPISYYGRKSIYEDTRVPKL